MGISEREGERERQLRRGRGGGRAGMQGGEHGRNERLRKRIILIYLTTLSFYRKLDL